MKFYNLFLLCSVVKSIYAIDIFDFKNLVPAKPKYEGGVFDSKTGASVHLNEDDDIQNSIDDVINDYMKEYHSDVEYKIKDFTNIFESNEANVNMVQTRNGIEITNSEIKVNVNTKHAYISSFDKGVWKKFSSINEFSNRDMGVSVKFMVMALAEQMNISNFDVDKVEFVQTSKSSFLAKNVTFSSDGEARLRKVYVVEEGNHLEAAWELNFLHDFVYITYNLRDSNGDVFTGLQYLSSFNEGNISDIIQKIDQDNIFYDPADLKSEFTRYSPLGWHKDNKVSYGVTIGNNVRVRNDLYGAAASLSNDYLRECERDDRKYMNADDVVHNGMQYTFYTINLLHDVFYYLGFDEANKNMQKYNFGKGGKENDRLQVIVDKNCDLKSDPEKLRISITVYEDGTIPYLLICGNYDKYNHLLLDGAFSSTVLAHEYAHAVLLRLAGEKFGYAYNDGMEPSLNEGFSDFFAEALHYKPGMDRNTPFKINYSDRKYPISSDRTINPLTYSSFDQLASDSKENAHYYGQIWATILHEVFWDIIEHYEVINNKTGELRQNRYTVWDLVYGNVPRSEFPYHVLFLRGIVKSYPDLRFTNSKNQIVSSFIRARDVIIRKVFELFKNDEFECVLRRGFAKRGLGSNAKEPQQEYYDGLSAGYLTAYDDYSIPEECKEYFDDY